MSLEQVTDGSLVLTSKVLIQMQKAFVAWFWSVSVSAWELSARVSDVKFKVKINH